MKSGSCLSGQHLQATSFMRCLSLGLRTDWHQTMSFDTPIRRGYGYIGSMIRNPLPSGKFIVFTKFDPFAGELKREFG
jgi:hypothetical protein